MSIVGLDLGNRYVKVFTDEVQDEVIVSRKLPKDTEEYESTEPTDSVLKVIYKGNKYIFGDIGEIGIQRKNKGDVSVRDHSNMVKLIMLARMLKAKNETEGEFKIVTGTPYDDYEVNKQDYLDLMVSQEPESIIINDVEYKINVIDTHITKQAACVILTLPDRKTANYLIWDFGGGTLDVSYYEKGIRVKGQTVDFSLNEIYKKLGNHVNKYVPVDRPELNDARFQKSMETLVLTGKYKSTSVVMVRDKKVALEKIVHEYLQKEVDQVIEKTINELDFTTTTLSNLTNVFVGGGSKLLEKELLENVRLEKKIVQEDPAFANARAYNVIGKAKKWSKDNG